MLICLIECTGTFTTDPPTKKDKLCRRFTIYNNTIRITSGHYLAYISHHIRHIFTKEDVARLISSSIETIVKRKVLNFTFRVCNIQYKQTLKDNARNVVANLLPTLHHTFEINKILTIQEQNQPANNSVEEILKIGRNFSFMSLSAKLLESTATLKIQPDKKGKKSHLTLIISKVTPKHIELVQFLNQNG